MLIRESPSAPLDPGPGWQVQGGGVGNGNSPHRFCALRHCWVASIAIGSPFVRRFRCSHGPGPVSLGLDDSYSSPDSEALPTVLVLTMTVCFLQGFRLLVNCSDTLNAGGLQGIADSEALPTAVIRVDDNVWLYVFQRVVYALQKVYQKDNDLGCAVCTPAVPELL